MRRPWIADLPATRKRMVAGVIGGVWLLVIFVGGINPKQAEIAALQAEIVHLDQQLRTSMSKRMALRSLETQLEDLRRNERTWMTQLSVSENVTSLRRAVAEIAQRVGVVMVSWKPDLASSSPWGPVRKVPVMLRIVGTYHRTTRFLKEVLGHTGVHRLESLGMHVPSAKAGERVLETEVRFLGVIAREAGPAPTQVTHASIDSSALAGS